MFSVVAKIKSTSKFRMTQEKRRRKKLKRRRRRKRID
jgi:hypothetical protein